MQCSQSYSQLFGVDRLKTPVFISYDNGICEKCVNFVVFTKIQDSRLKLSETVGSEVSRSMGSTIPVETFVHSHQLPMWQTNEHKI